MTIDIHCSDFMFFFIHQCNVVKRNRFLKTIQCKNNLVVDISESIWERNMAVGGRQAVRDALTFAFAENVTEDVEFALLYDYNRSKHNFTYWKYEEFDVETWDDVEYRTELHFGQR